MNNFGTEPGFDPKPFGENPRGEGCTCVSIMEIKGYIQIVDNGDGTCTSTIVDGGIEEGPGWKSSLDPKDLILPNPGVLKARQTTMCVPDSWGPTNNETDIPIEIPSSSGSRFSDDVMVSPVGHLKNNHEGGPIRNYPSKGKSTTVLYIGYKVAKNMGFCSCEESEIISDTGWSNFSFGANKPCSELLPFIEKVVSEINPHRSCSWHPPLV